MIFFQGGDVGDVKTRILEQVELILQIEIEKTFDGGMRSNYAGMQTVSFGQPFVFFPMFVASALRCGKGKRNAWFRAFYSRVQNCVGKQFGAERWKVLAIVFVEGQIKADTFQADLDAVIGIVAKADFDCENAGGIGRFFGEGRFVTVRGEPGIGGHGEPFVRIEGSCGDWFRGLLLLKSCKG